MSDYNHPTQEMGDFTTILNTCHPEKIKDLKIVFAEMLPSMCFIDDYNKIGCHFVQFDQRVISFKIKIQNILKLLKQIVKFPAEVT